MHRNLMKTIFLGTGISWLILLLLAAVCSLFVLKHVIPSTGIPTTALVIAGVAVLIGAWIAGRMAERARLPVCLGVGAGVILIALFCNGIMDRNLSGTFWVIPLVIMSAAFAGALLSSGTKRPKNMRKSR